MNLLKSITDLIIGRKPTTRQQRRAARRAALAKMGMTNRPNPPPKSPGYKNGDKRKGPAS